SISATMTSYGVLPGSRQGKERPFGVNQERSRLRNQEIRLTDSGEISYGTRTGCPTRLIPILYGGPPYRLQGRHCFLKCSKTYLQHYRTCFTAESFTLARARASHSTGEFVSR